MAGDGDCYIDSQGFVREIPHPNDVIDAYIDLLKRPKEQKLVDGASKTVDRNNKKEMQKLAPIQVDKIKEKVISADSKIV